MNNGTTLRRAHCNSSLLPRVRYGRPFVDYGQASLQSALNTPQPMFDDDGPGKRSCRNVGQLVRRVNSCQACPSIQVQAIALFEAHWRRKEIVVQDHFLLQCDQ